MHFCAFFHIKTLELSISFYMIVCKISFVLFIGKLVSYLYNLVQSRISIKHDPEYTYERKIICKKTARALLCETVTYGVIFIVAAFIKA